MALEFVPDKAGKYLIFHRGSHEQRVLAATVTRTKDFSSVRWHTSAGAPIFEDVWRVDWFEEYVQEDDVWIPRHSEIFETLPSLHDRYQFANYPGYQCLLDRNRNGKNRIKR